MAQVRRQTRNPSPPPRQMPLLPNPIRFYPRPPSSSANIRRTQSLQVSSNQTKQQPNINHNSAKSPQTDMFSHSKDDPLTDLLTNSVSTGTNGTYKQSYITNSLLNQPANHHPPAPQSRLMNHEGKARYRYIFYSDELSIGF